MSNTYNTNSLQVFVLGILYTSLLADRSPGRVVGCRYGQNNDAPLCDAASSWEGLIIIRTAAHLQVC